ncbi:MAG TPA: hypothetical protein QF446_10550 [Planctomycetota bacterium]|nr:hypothetical protein [Planctomycetota bacterium]
MQGVHTHRSPAKPPDEVNYLYGKPGMEALSAALRAELERLREHYQIP